MLQTQIYDPFFFFGPAQEAISRVMVNIATGGVLTVNPAGTRATWSPFIGASFEITIKGSGLGATGNALTGGTLKTFETNLVGTGAPIITVSNLNLAATTYQAAVDGTVADQAAAGETLVWAGIDLREKLFDPRAQTVIGSDQFERLIGGDKKDVISTGLGDDTIDVTFGNDILTGNGGNNRLDFRIVGETNDITYDLSIGTIEMSDGTTQTTTGFINVEGGAGDDTFTGDDFANIIAGKGGNDTIHGQGGNDTITGGDGFDRLHGGEGNDLIQGGDGVDDIFGDGGDDELFGEGKTDFIRGGTGNDLINGGKGDDNLRGEAGKDKILGGDGDDLMFGGNGNDIMRGGGGSEALPDPGFPALLTTGMFGGGGRDRMFGGGKRDIMDGGTGNDTMRGQKGNDTLLGDAGNDNLNGGDGKDLIDGGIGDDILTGGKGVDQFVFANSFIEGSDRIMDFEAGEQIILNGQDLGDVAITGSTSATITHLGGEITVFGVSSALLMATTSGTDVLVGFA